MKVSLGFGLVLVILAAIGLVAYFSFDSVATSTQTYTQRVVVVGIARDTDREFLEMRRQVREFAFTNNDAAASMADAAAGLVRAKLDEASATIHSGTCQ
jgi:CHASE3 domain sensor protein